MITEKRRFSLHPLAIHTFIEAQAGSLAKALSESVMNSFDAFASRVDISLTKNSFSVKDDGQGFQSKEEIESWFEVLGFPHEEGNHRTWGQFGMGRAQAWAFASTTWRSNQFQMEVDVKKKGLDYDLSILTNPEPGTLIVGTMYAPMSEVDLARTVQELRELLKFVQGEVYLNNIRVNQNPAEMQWDKETADAWMDVKAASGYRGRGLSVYNAGVLVCTLGTYQYGCEGILVTKPDSTLKLNLARNQILEAECPVWKRIKAQLPSRVKKVAKLKEPTLSHREKEALLTKLAGDHSILPEVLEKLPEMLVDVGGRKLTLHKLAYGRVPVLVAPKGDAAGKKLMKLRMAQVLAESSLQGLGLTLSELRAVCDPMLRIDPEKASQYTNKNFVELHNADIDNRVWSMDPKSVFPDFYAGRQLIHLTELTPVQKAGVLAWQYTFGTIRSELEAAAAFKPGMPARVRLIRNLCCGDSPDDMVWLHDEKTVVLRLKEMHENMGRQYGRLGRYVMQVTREICEFLTDSPEEAEQLFVRAVTQTNIAGTVPAELVRRYSNLCQRFGVELPPLSLVSLETATAAEA